MEALHRDVRAGWHAPGRLLLQGGLVALAATFAAVLVLSVVLAVPVGAATAVAGVFQLVTTLAVAGRLMKKEGLRRCSH